MSTKFKKGDLMSTKFKKGDLMSTKFDVKNRINRLFFVLLFISTLIFISQIVIVDAYIPVTYSCCISYITDQGTLLDNFENIDNWALNGLNTSYIVADILNFKEGKQGLKLVTKNGDKVFTTSNIYDNFPNTKNFAFDIYIYDPSTLGYLTFYFTSQRNWSKYFYYTIRSPPRNGWNHFIIKKSDMINMEGEDWNNTMIMFRLTSYTITGKDTNITIDNFRYNVSERAKIIFTFDDGTIGDSDIAEPILTANNQRAVSFVTISWLNFTGYMTIDNLKKLQDLGWDISSHTISHPNLTALDDNNLTIELNNSYDWLVNHGFQKSAGFIAYPFGFYNDKVIGKVKQRYIFARSIEDGIQPHMESGSGDGLYKLKIMEVRNNTSVQSVKNRIDSTIDQGQLIILLFHRIVSNNPTKYEYLESDFKQISDYVKSRSLDIDVITFSDYLAPNVNSFTPVIKDRVRIYPGGTVELMVNNKSDLYMPNMTIKPSSGSIDISINRYGENDDQFISFDEIASDPSIKVQYSIGDRIPNQNYSIKIYNDKNTILKTSYIKANDNGYINYYSTRFNSPRNTEIRPATIDGKTYVARDGEYGEYGSDEDSVLPTITPSTEHNGKSIFPFEILVMILVLIVLIMSYIKIKGR